MPLLLAKIFLIAFFAVILLVPVLILLLFFLAEFIGRIITKLFGYKSPAPPFLGPFLDSDIRRAFQPPQLIIQRSGIIPGMRVLEIGCGSGTYTTTIARWLGPTGTEYALDVQREMLEQLEEKLSREENRDIRNVTLVEGNATKLPFKDNFFDLVFMVSVLQQIPDRLHALEEVCRVLKPGGTLAITEMLLDPYYSRRQTTMRLGIAAGLVHEVTLGSLWHYTVRLKKRAPIEPIPAAK